MSDNFDDDNISEAEARVLFDEAVAEIDRIEASHFEQQQLKDFVAFLPTGQFIHKPTGAMWTAREVDEKLPPLEMKGEKKPLPASNTKSRCE
jgi:hypothetical protein